MRALLAGLLLPALGCVTASPVRTRPRGPDTTRTLAEVPVRGAPVVVTSEAGPLRVEGELLAVDAQHVWVEHEAAPCPVERTGFLVVRVQTGDGAPGKAGLWTALGTLSTLSHGVLLVATAPAWLLAGLVAIETEAANGAATFHDADLRTLGQFARFPQGLPESLWRCAAHAWHIEALPEWFTPPTPPPAPLDDIAP